MRTGVPEGKEGSVNEPTLEPPARGGTDARMRRDAQRTCTTIYLDLLSMGKCDLCGFESSDLSERTANTINTGGRRRSTYALLANNKKRFSTVLIRKDSAQRPSSPQRADRRSGPHPPARGRSAPAPPTCAAKAHPAFCQSVYGGADKGAGVCSCELRAA